MTNERLETLTAVCSSVKVHMDAVEDIAQPLDRTATAVEIASVAVAIRTLSHIVYELLAEVNTSDGRKTDRTKDDTGEPCRN